MNLKTSINSAAQKGAVEKSYGCILPLNKGHAHWPWQTMLGHPPDILSPAKTQKDMRVCS